MIIYIAQIPCKMSKCALQLACMRSNRKHWIYALWIENTSKDDPRCHEATKGVTNRDQKKFWGFNRIQTHDLHDTSVTLYQLSYEVFLGLGVRQEWALLHYGLLVPKYIINHIEHRIWWRYTHTAKKWIQIRDIGHFVFIAKPLPLHCSTNQTLIRVSDDNGML